MAVATLKIPDSVVNRERERAVVAIRSEEKLIVVSLYPELVVG